MSRIFSKILKATKGTGGETSELSMDGEAIRLHKQEIDDARQSLAAAKKDMADSMAKEIQCEREIQQLQQEMDRYEVKAMKALEDGNETMVEDLAEKIAEVENQLATEKAVGAEYRAHANRLKDLMKKAERAILENERELTMIKTTDSVRKANHSIAQSGAPTLKAKNSLQRIKQRQESVERRWAAEQELEKGLSGNTLKQKTQGSIDTETAKTAVLERLRKRAGK
ncbi:MAG: hypothetical protein AMJ53_08380 [Gammaproteobacteria bacterium SG8_11]|nr:MAG: hypothetical protein AMJ53_08380 [Gammaproteobacteria bacterium SG8_11]